MSKKIKDLKDRCFSSFIIITLLAIVISLSDVFSFLFVILVTLLAVVGIWEYFQLAQLKKFAPNITLGITASVCIIFTTFLGTNFPAMANTYWIIIIAASLLSLCYFRETDNPLANTAITIFGIVYVGLSLSLLIKIRYFDFQDQSSIWWLIYLLAVTKMTDIGALFVGKKLGRHVLARQLSPDKTLEGSIGGIVSALVTSLLLTYFGKTHQLEYITTWTQSIWLGAVVSIIGQIGDLAESSLKRDASVKDSNCLPGLGGILDMIDSLLFTIPTIYFFMEVMY